MILTNVPNRCSTRRAPRPTKPAFLIVLGAFNLQTIYIVLFSPVFCTRKIIGELIFIINLLFTAFYFSTSLAAAGQDRAVESS